MVDKFVEQSPAPTSMSLAATLGIHLNGTGSSTEPTYVKPFRARAACQGQRTRHNPKSSSTALRSVTNSRRYTRGRNDECVSQSTAMHVFVALHGAMAASALLNASSQARRRSTLPTYINDCRYPQSQSLPLGDVTRVLCCLALGLVLHDGLLELSTARVGSTG